MITDSNTNWRNVWDIQETSTTALPELIADGRLTIARAAKAYARHIVPTPLVTLTANHQLSTRFPEKITNVENVSNQT